MYENEQIQFSDVSKVSVSKWLLLYIYSVFAFIIYVIGLLMCFIPGIVVLVQFAFLPFIVVLEEEAHILKNFPSKLVFRFQRFLILSQSVGANFLHACILTLSVMGVESISL